MRKLLLLFLAVSSLAAASTAAELARPAAAATKTVNITHIGYNPTSVAIEIGDTVVFTNGDAVAHTVRFNPTTGIHCNRAIPLVLQPGQSEELPRHRVGREGADREPFAAAEGRHLRPQGGPLRDALEPADGLVLAGPRPGVWAGGADANRDRDDNGRGCLQLPSTATEEHGLHGQVQELQQHCRDRQGPATAAPRENRTAPLLAGCLRCSELRREVRELPALPPRTEALGDGEARPSARERHGRSPDGDHIREVPLPHQGGVAGACHSHAGAGRLLLPRRTQQHDPQLNEARSRRAGGSDPALLEHRVGRHTNSFWLLRQQPRVKGRGEGAWLGPACSTSLLTCEDPPGVITYRPGCADREFGTDTEAQKGSP